MPHRHAGGALRRDAEAVKSENVTEKFQAQLIQIPIEICISPACAILEGNPRKYIGKTGQKSYAIYDTNRIHRSDKRLAENFHDFLWMSSTFMRHAKGSDLLFSNRDLMHKIWVRTPNGEENTSFVVPTGTCVRNKCFLATNRHVRCNASYEEENERVPVPR